jgi:hypothetical protein
VYIIQESSLLYVLGPEKLNNGKKNNKCSVKISNNSISTIKVLDPVPFVGCIHEI